MTTPISIHEDYLIAELKDLVNTPSPTGYAGAAIERIARALEKLGLEPHQTTKGSLIATLRADAEDAPRALTAHADTLGAMVKEIKDSGRLKLSKIGGFAWNTVEGEGCTIHTTSGKTIRGALLLTSASSHIHGSQVTELKRSDETMEVRLDERTDSAEQTRSLGIGVGDFVSFDPRLEIAPSGFIRSRHLDDKASVACVLAALRAIQENRLKLAQRTTAHFSNYEEVGHGAAAGFPPDLVELVTVDMAAVGEGQTSDEFHTTICAKDSGGPYHVALTRRLRSLAESEGIPHRVDVFPYYGSDGEAYWRAGGDVQVALMGPGVDASHNYERTHMSALVATAQLLVAYLTS